MLVKIWLCLRRKEKKKRSNCLLRCLCQFICTFSFWGREEKKKKKKKKKKRFHSTSNLKQRKITGEERKCNSDHTQNYRTNTNLFLDSYFPSTNRAWNNLPTEIKNATSLSIFKSLLNRNMQRPPKCFNAGHRIGQILHAGLRMGCSSLNSDLYRKHIVASPSCHCGAFESAKHFLFRCPNYSIARHRYLHQDLDSHSLKDLMYGKTSYSLQENVTLFSQVQDFIVKSGRFV